VVSVTTRPSFSPGERIPSTHWTGGWVNPGAGWTQRLEEKFFASAGDRTWIAGRPVLSQTLYILNELPWLQIIRI
jgi:hypothetical protein